MHTLYRVRIAFENEQQFKLSSMQSRLYTVYRKPWARILALILVTLSEDYRNSPQVLQHSNLKYSTTGFFYALRVMTYNEQILGQSASLNKSHFSTKQQTYILPEIIHFSYHSTLHIAAGKKIVSLYHILYKALVYHK
jgi:hypothetical protein